MTTATVNDLRVFMDVVCFHNGKANATSGYRLHFAPITFPPVMAVRLPGRETINRANLHALLRAIQETQSMSAGRIVFQTRSELLVGVFRVTTTIHLTQKHTCRFLCR